jgi:hypothetical protein
LKSNFHNSHTEVLFCSAVLTMETESVYCPNPQ